MAEQAALNDARDAGLGFDHYSKEFGADPLKVGLELNRLGVSRSEFYGGFYVLGTHDAVSHSLLNPAVFRSGRPADEPELQGILIPSNYHGLPVIPAETDGKQHRDLRRAMNPDFTKDKAIAWRDRFQYWSTVYLDEAITTGAIDFAADYADPIAFIFAIEMLGLAVEDWRKWQEPTHLVIYAAPESAEMRDGVERWAANLAELKELVQERRSHPQDDFMSRMGAARIDGAPISDDDVVALCVIVMMGAVDTTASLVTHALMYLDDHPEERAALANSDARLERAIEEWLRFYAPIHGTSRTVAEETELGGCPMRRGDRVMQSYLAANHDPAKFDDPNTVKLDRWPNPHLAFAGGVHKCIGLHFARMEALVVIQEVLRRLPDYRMQREAMVPLPNSAFITGHMHLPAEFTPGERLQADRAP